MPANRRGKGRRTHQTTRQACRGPARPADGKLPRGRPSRFAAAGRAARAGGRNASAGANSAAAARQARFSLNRKDRPHCGNGAFAGAETGGSRRRGFCGGLMRMCASGRQKPARRRFCPYAALRRRRAAFALSALSYALSIRQRRRIRRANGGQPGRPTAARRGGRRSFPRFSTACFPVSFSLISPFLIRPFCSRPFPVSQKPRSFHTRRKRRCVF